MRHIAVKTTGFGLALVLAACQTTTQPITQAPAAASGPDAERRAMIDGCLARIGRDPLPDDLGGLNAPMDKAEADVFMDCMQGKDA